MNERTKINHKGETAGQAVTTTAEPTLRSASPWPMGQLDDLHDAAGNAAVSQLVGQTTETTNDDNHHGAAEQPAELEPLPSANATYRDAAWLPPGVRSFLSNNQGRPLDPATRTHMESRFGYDFSAVRIHTGKLATRSANDVNAAAYTVGHDIVMGSGYGISQTGFNERTLSHELTHTIQQRTIGSKAPAFNPQTPSEQAAVSNSFGASMSGPVVGQAVAVGLARQSHFVSTKKIDEKSLLKEIAVVTQRLKSFGVQSIQGETSDLEHLSTLLSAWGFNTPKTEEDAQVLEEARLVLEERGESSFAPQIVSADLAAGDVSSELSAPIAESEGKESVTDGSDALNLGNEPVTDLTSQWVNQAFSHQELVTRLLSSHWSSQADRRNFLRSYFIERFNAFGGQVPSEEVLLQLVDTYDSIVRENEWERQRPVESFEDSRFLRDFIQNEARLSELTAEQEESKPSIQHSDSLGTLLLNSSQKVVLDSSAIEELSGFPDPIARQIKASGGLFTTRYVNHQLSGLENWDELRNRFRIRFLEIEKYKKKWFDIKYQKARRLKLSDIDAYSLAISSINFATLVTSNKKLEDAAKTLGVNIVVFRPLSKVGSTSQESDTPSSESQSLPGANQNEDIQGLDPLMRKEMKLRQEINPLTFPGISGDSSFNNLAGIQFGYDTRFTEDELYYNEEWLGFFKGHGSPKERWKSHQRSSHASQFWPDEVTKIRNTYIRVTEANILKWAQDWAFAGNDAESLIKGVYSGPEFVGHGRARRYFANFLLDNLDELEFAHNLGELKRWQKWVDRGVSMEPPDAELVLPEEAESVQNQPIDWEELRRHNTIWSFIAKPEDVFHDGRFKREVIFADWQMVYFKMRGYVYKQTQQKFSEQAGVLPTVIAEVYERTKHIPVLYKEALMLGLDFLPIPGLGRVAGYIVRLAARSGRAAGRLARGTARLATRYGKKAKDFSGRTFRRLETRVNTPKTPTPRNNPGSSATTTTTVPGNQAARVQTSTPELKVLQGGGQKTSPRQGHLRDVSKGKDIKAQRKSNKAANDNIEEQVQQQELIQAEQIELRKAAGAEGVAGIGQQSRISAGMKPRPKTGKSASNQNVVKGSSTTSQAGGKQSASVSGSSSGGAAGAGRSRNSYPDFEDIPSASQNVTQAEVKKLSSQLGIDLPQDRVLSAPWIGRIRGSSGKTRSISTSQGWLRSESKFWKKWESSFPDDAKLLGKGRTVSPELAKKYGWPESVVGDKLVHHHIGNSTLAVAIPESIHRKLSGVIHATPKVY